MLTSNAERATTVPTSTVACRTKLTRNVRSSDDAPLTLATAWPVRLARILERIQKPAKIATNLMMFQAQRMPPCSENAQLLRVAIAAEASLTSTSRPLTALE